MTCHELIDALLDDYLERVLAPDSLARLERHLAECEPCRAYLATYRRARELGAAVARVDMPDDVRQRLRQFLGGGPPSPAE